MDIDLTIRQVSRYRRTISADKEYFDRLEGGFWFFQDGGNVVLSLTRPSGPAVRGFMRHFGRKGRRTVRVIVLPQTIAAHFRTALDYVTVREIGEDFILSPATQSEVDMFGNAKHVPAESGKIRRHNVIYFTPEEKDILAIEIGEWMTVHMDIVGKKKISYRKSTRKEIKTLPGLNYFSVRSGKSCLKQPVTFKVRYASAVALPMPFIRAAQVDTDDVLRVTRYKHQITFSPTKKCAICGNSIQYFRETDINTVVGEACSKKLENVRDLIKEHSGSPAAALASTL